MASSFQSIKYQRVPSHTEDDDDSSELPPTVVTTRHAEKNNSMWNISFLFKRTVFFGISYKLCFMFHAVLYFCVLTIASFYVYLLDAIILHCYRTQ